MPSTALQTAFAQQRAAFAADPYPSASQRRAHLKRLIHAVLAQQDQIAAALKQDFSARCRDEVLFSEVFTALHTLRDAVRNVASWMEDRPVPVEWPLLFASAWVMPQPLGVTGIVSPWNYPIYLTLGPLAGALAAGNRVLIKPSEFTPATSSLLANLIAGCFAPDHVAVIQGDAATAADFVQLPFDHLLFTGSTTTGRQVARAAAENLTPVTLELGGKSPVLLTPSASLKPAAGSLVYAKLLNAGQTCVAPDYVLVPESRLQPFLAAYRAQVDRQFPDAVSNPDYTAIINHRHFARLTESLAEAQSAGAEILTLASAPSNERRLAPTLVVNPPDHSRLMREEIFGPILPVKTYRTLDDAIAFINARPRPLALYLFTGRQREIDAVLRRTHAGGVAVNETILQIVAAGLPFGGIGPSGMGHYHGQAGFDTFSKLKPVFRRHGFGLSVLLRPPYGLLHRLMRKILIG